MSVIVVVPIFASRDSPLQVSKLISGCRWSKLQSAAALSPSSLLAADKAGAHASATYVTQEAANLPIKEETAVQPVKDREHAAHAAALSLESVIEAQSALLQERHQWNQPDMTEEEKKAHRRRLDIAQSAAEPCTVVMSAHVWKTGCHIQAVMFKRLLAILLLTTGIVHNHCLINAPKMSSV